MTFEQAMVNVEKQRIYYDNLLDTGNEEGEEEITLDSKPEEINIDFYIPYYGKKLALCTTEKFDGEETAIKEAKEVMLDCMEEIKDMKKSDKHYTEWLATIWACKDYIDGEV